MIARRASAGAAFAMVLTGAAACSGGGGQKVASIKDGGSSSSSSASGDNAKVDFKDAMLEYSRCMREHGVNLPDPTFTEDGGGVAIGIAAGESGGMPDPNGQVFKDADKACKPILDKAEQSMPKPSAEELARMRDEGVKFAQCMRDKGFDVPDPTFDDTGKVGIEVHSDAGGGPSNDGNGPGMTKGTPDPKFLEASKECGQGKGSFHVMDDNGSGG
jgi:hypothetical protein